MPHVRRSPTPGIRAAPGSPHVTLITGGSVYEAAVRDGIQRELGIPLIAEEMPFDDYSDRLDNDTPAMWSLGWSADYPHPNDFLGLLLETGSPSNPGGWSDAAFDAAIDAAASTADLRQQEAALRGAQRDRAGPGAGDPARAMARAGHSAVTGCWAHRSRASASCATPASTGPTSEPTQRPPDRAWASGC